MALKDEVIQTVVDSADAAAGVLYDLLGPPDEEPLVAVDTETVGCNPKKESPVLKAELWCMTLAWRLSPSIIGAAFVPADWVPAFKAWLGSSKYRKVGQNIFGYDRHVFNNAGCPIQGIVGDTLRMSKLLDPRNEVEHGLKAQARNLGVPMVEFEDVATTVWHGKEKPATKTKGACTPINLEKRSQEEISTLGADEWRRAKIMKYAVDDAVATLLVYEDLVDKLAGVKW